MTDQESTKNSKSPHQRKSSYSLGTLISILTIGVILAAWFVDHQRLVKQISPPSQENPAQVYRLSNASAKLAANELNKVVKSGTIVPETVSNSLIVSAEQNDLQQIEKMIQFIDRKVINLIEDKTQASNDESESQLIQTK